MRRDTASRAVTIGCQPERRSISAVTWFSHSTKPSRRGGAPRSRLRATTRRCPSTVTTTRTWCRVGSYVTCTPSPSASARPAAAPPSPTSASSTSTAAKGAGGETPLWCGTASSPGVPCACSNPGETTANGRVRPTISNGGGDGIPARLPATPSRTGRPCGYPAVVRELVVFSGSAHRALAREICSNLGVPLSPADVIRFSNDCLQVQLQANCRQRDVYVVQPLVPPTQEHLMELLLMLDAARGASASQVTAVIPHFAYARSDKKDASRISIGGRLVADLLVAAGADPDADDDAARAAGARLLLGPGRPPHRDRRARRPLPRHRPHQHRRGVARPRQRQDRHPVRPAARADRSPPAASSGCPTTG